MSDQQANDDALKKISAELKEFLGDDVPRSHTHMANADFLIVTANRAGLISLSRTCLQAVLSPVTHPSESLPESHEQLEVSPDDLRIGLIQHAEVVPIPEAVIAEWKRKAWESDRIALFGCGLFCFVMLFL